MPYIAVKLATEQTLTEVQQQLLIEGITQVMAETLHKKRHLVAISLEYLPVQQWFIAGQDLTTNSAFIEAYITEGTNSETEKSQAITELYALATQALGQVEEATYIVLNNRPATDWGYAGKTQASRYSAPPPLPPLDNVQYNHYVQRAHALQKAAVRIYALKLIKWLKSSLKHALKLGRKVFTSYGQHMASDKPTN